MTASISVFAAAQALFSVFVAAFILRTTGNDISLVIAFEGMMFGALPVAAWLNAFVRRRFRAVSIYAAAIVLQAAAFVVLTAGFAVDLRFALFTGLLFGIDAGFLWPNRNTLVLEALPDSQRNRYFGIEELAVVVAGVLVPVAAGAFIVSGLVAPAAAYQVLAAGAFLLSAVSAWVLLRAGCWRFDPPRMRFRFWVDPAWNWFVPFSITKGCLHFYVGILPALFVGAVLGRGEGMLGVVQGAGGLVAAVAVFLIGRWTGPAARVKVYAIASILYIVSAVSNAVLRTPLMAIAFLGCLAVAQPAVEFAFCAIEMKVFDHCEASQPGSTCFFLCAFETMIGLGRVLAALGYFAVAAFLPQTTALVIVIAAVGGVQLLSIFLARATARAASR